MMMRAGSTQKHFPDKVETEIQLRLPPKSLFRFKSVSKSWASKISGPNFKDMYQTKSVKSPNLIFCKTNQMDDGATEWSSLDTAKSLSLTNIFNTKIMVMNMMVTCHGMICFLGMTNNSFGENKVHLFCFKTKKLFVLPTDSSSNFSKGPIVGFGIGYLACIKKYKVCLVVMGSSEGNRQFPNFNCQVIEISTMNGDGRRNCSKWRVVAEDLQDLVVACFYPPVSVENSIYWKTWYNDKIVSFDIKNEKFGRVKYPSGNDFSATDDIRLVDLQGKLGLSLTDSTNHHFTMVLWKLQDSVNNIWEKTCMISPAEAMPNSLKPMIPVYVQDREIVMYSAGCLVFYNLEENTYKIVKVDVSLDHSLVGVYYETLYDS